MEGQPGVGPVPAGLGWALCSSSQTGPGCIPASRSALVWPRSPCVGPTGYVFERLPCVWTAPPGPGPGPVPCSKEGTLEQPFRRASIYTRRFKTSTRLDLFSSVGWDKGWFLSFVFFEFFQEFPR